MPDREIAGLPKNISLWVIGTAILFFFLLGGDKMKHMLIGFLTIVFTVCLQGSIIAAQPESYDSMVTGKGEPNTDIKAVQKVVDQGGSVLLKGTFDFGEDGKVIISKDVNIYGETDAQGAPVTKIQGGFRTFQSTLPEQLPPQAPGPKIGIQGIQFEGALETPISLPYCGGTNIVNNKITKVRPIEATGMYQQRGITIVVRPYQPGAVTGTIVIADNDIDLSNDTPEKTLGGGVLIIGATGANIQILRNRVVNCSRNSLESLDNYPGEDGSGMTIFKGNKIVTATKGIPVPTPDTPNGIVSGWFLNIAGATDPTRWTKIVVTENQIETRGDSSLGIIILSDRAVITSNHIFLKGGPNAKGILHLNSDSIIANNKIEGSASCAVMVTEYQQFKPCRNVMIGNDVQLFKASMADVFLGGSSNIVVQEKGNIVDKGKINLIMK